MTSAEALGRYIPGVLRRASVGPAWKDLRAHWVEQPRDEDSFAVPGVAEPFLVRVSSGEALIEERSPGGSWTSVKARPGCLFLTGPGLGYEMRVHLLGNKPFVTFQVLIGLPLMARAGAEVFGSSAMVRLRDGSDFLDGFVSEAMARLEAELRGDRAASVTLVQGLAGALAVHLVRHYTIDTEMPAKTGGLSGNTLRRITDQMGKQLDQSFSLGHWSALAGMSASHFSRSFKQSTGLSPIQYFLSLRIAAARRLLRETRRNVLQIGLDVGYSSPSHFAQVFRRHTGLSPVDYRRTG